MDARGISFHTPELTLDNSQVIWISGRKQYIAVPQLDLQFNYRVNPTDLKDKLKIEVDGKKRIITDYTCHPIIKYLFALIGLEDGG